MSSHNEPTPVPADSDPRVQLREEVRDAVKSGGGLLIVSGILAILAGIFCLMAPAFAGWVTTLMIGVMMIVLGVLQIAGGIDMPKKTKGRGWTIIGGVAAIVLGLLFVTRTFDALSMITWILAVFLVVEGVLRIVGSLELKPAEGWAWPMVGGITSIILGFLLMAGWPASALWFVGTVIGIHFLMSGFARVMLGAAARSAAKRGG
jgi:uncharacterized membrane protein HdeD (DUF308 family)